MKRFSELLLLIYISLYLIILCSTEILSLLHLINSWSVYLVWLVASVAALFLLRRNSTHDFYRGLKTLRRKTGIILAHLRPLTFFRRILRLDPAALIYLSLFFLLSITLFTALAYPPNNWDSMTYHMGRIPHWIQNQSIGYYPTSIERQNFSAPLAESAIMQLQLLTRSDYLANIPQWLAFCMSILTSGLIARELGGRKRSRLFAMIITACIPMALLQSSSTQNDLILGSFVMIFTFYMLRAYNTRTFRVLPTAMALGLALATKGNGYLYIGITGTLYSLAIILQNLRRRGRLRSSLRSLLLIIIFGLILNTGISLRNIGRYGKPLYSGTGILCTEHTPDVLYGNIVRNSLAQLNLIIPRSSLQSLSGVLLPQRCADPAATNPFELPGQSFHEDTIANFFHFILGIICVILFFIFSRRVRLYLFSLLCMALMYCLLIRWQLWGSRLQLPLFLLISPVIALGVLRIPFRIIRLIPLILIIILGVLTSVRNSSRPPFNIQRLRQERNTHYFKGIQNLYPTYTKVASIIGSGSNVGMLFRNSDWYEYPLWVMTGSHAGQKTASRFSYISPEDTDTDRAYDYILTDTPAQGMKLFPDAATVYTDQFLTLLRVRETD